MKVTVTKFLNVRVGKPSVNAPNYQYLAPGSILEIDGKIYEGDTYNDNNKWYRDEANNYYWSGGVLQEDKAENSDNQLEIKINPNKLQWWHRDYGIDKIWNTYSLGSGVKIAVLDTGYDKKHPYSRKDIDGWNPIDKNSDFHDYNGHGTSVISLINNQHKEILGVAPESSVYSYKVEKRDPDIDAFIDALNRCAQSDVDIISISYRFSNKDKATIERMLKSIQLNSDKIIVCAVGNAPDNGTLAENYPAMFPSTLAIGSINEQRAISKYSSRSKCIDITAPGDSLKLVDVYSQKLDSFKGTSYAAPYVSAVIALMISYVRKIKPQISIKTLDIKQILLDTADHTNSMDSELYGKGIINPLKAFQKLHQKINS